MKAIWLPSGDQAGRSPVLVKRRSPLPSGVIVPMPAEAAVLANGPFSPGRYAMRWGAASQRLAAGVYFVRLETPDGLFTRRVAMIR